MKKRSDKKYNPPQYSPLHPVHVHWIFVGRTQTGKLSPLGESDEHPHDSVNRFLNRESYDGEDLFNEVKGLVTSTAER